MTDRAKIVDFYLQKITDNDFEISEVRKDMERNKFEEEEIKIIVRLVDNELQRRLLTATSNKKATDLVYIGTVITLIGVVITVGTYTGLIPMGDSFLIVYGPFLGGLATLFTGLAKRRRV
jgi:hypothetical protein